MGLLRSIIGVWISVCLFTSIAHSQNVLLKTKIANGWVEGVSCQEGDVVSFKGIPFAAPPIGDLRWKAPQPATSWNDIRKCDAFGPSPIQGKPVPFNVWTKEFLIPDSPISEDCLYLNVWTGTKSNKEKRPVLVWIYGGGFGSGGAGVPIYDGEYMARNGIVFVSFNYRVGILGFLSHPELTKESDVHASGNYGILDQIAALKWVQQNIASFGGDPDNVTIAGQSAGSMSVNVLVASPLSKGLFTKAIAESGANFTRGQRSLEQAEEDGTNLMKELKVNSISEMRKLPVDILLKKQLSMRGPIIDGYVLPSHVLDIFESGKENNIALLTGWNEDDGILMGPPKGSQDYVKQVQDEQGTDAKKYLQFYPGNTDAEAMTSAIKISRDMIFGVQGYKWAEISSSKGKKVFVYRFSRIVPAEGEYKKYGAFHTGEVAYAYGNLKYLVRPLTSEDQRLSKLMSSYWINFIRTGNPNQKDLPYWPEYKIKEKKIMKFDATSQVVSLHDAEALEFMYHKILK